MTPARAALIAALLDAPTDAAFQREYLDRGGRYQVYAGIPAKQDRLRRELPVRYVAVIRQERENERIA